MLWSVSRCQCRCWIVDLLGRKLLCAQDVDTAGGVHMGQVVSDRQELVAFLHSAQVRDRLKGIGTINKGAAMAIADVGDRSDGGIFYMCLQSANVGLLEYPNMQERTGGSIYCVIEWVAAIFIHNGGDRWGNLCSEGLINVNSMEGLGELSPIDYLLLDVIAPEDCSANVGQQLQVIGY
ncbi:hypothetical protein F0562_030479 [Nyssa sinensis]|uniref:Uncharacterized protein n=1 Tax=Nyssa sinensis TaxID=561372 RepID=A0A5J5AZX1_9ASTE|nr:hypothetical protein F0562_030479 [Nyssa sinensis]